MKAGCDSRQRSVAARRATTGSASSIAVAPPTCRHVLEGAPEIALGRLV